MGSLDPDKRERLAETLYNTANPSVSKDNFVWRFREELKDVNGSNFWIDQVEKWILYEGHRDEIKTLIEHNSKNPRAIYDYLAGKVKVK